MFDTSGVETHPAWRNTKIGLRSSQFFEVDDRKLPKGASTVNIAFRQYRYQMCCKAPAFRHGDINHTLFPHIWHYRDCISLR